MSESEFTLDATYSRKDGAAAVVVRVKRRTGRTLLELIWRVVRSTLRVIRRRTPRV